MNYNLGLILFVGLVIGLVYVAVIEPMLDLRLQKKLERRNPRLIHSTCTFTDIQTGRCEEPVQARREAEKLWDRLFSGPAIERRGC